ncbi:MAG: type II secretion system minor pseudopilin GspJ [Pseudomonadota bacterium]
MTRKKSRRQAAQRGFTLLEILAAVAILALIGTAASMIFVQALDNRERVGERAEALAGLQRAFLFMQRDFEQTVPRGARDELGDAQSSPMTTREGAVELTRTGWINPLQTRQRSTLQRVRYRLEDGRLWREYWDHPDRLAGSEPVSSVLLDDVLSFRVEFLFRPEEGGKETGEYTWHDSWPLDDDLERAPAYRRAPLAVSVEIETRRFGTLKRFFRMTANPHARET